MNSESICLVAIIGIASTAITTIGVVWIIFWYKVNSIAMKSGYVRRSLPGCQTPVWTKDREV